MIRLFIAIAVPSPLSLLLSDMGRSIQGARHIPPGQIHLTLRFIGNTDEPTRQLIESLLAGIHFPSPRVELSGTGFFPPHGSPRIIWAGLKRDTSLHKLKRMLDTQLLAAGIQRDQRRFSPHITLARPKTISFERISQFIRETEDFTADTFYPDHFHLYSSRLTPKGPIYTREKSYPFLPHHSPATTYL